MKPLRILSVMMFLAVAVCRCATMSTTSYDDVPLPGSIDIVSPNPNLAPEIRAFSGKWAGTWDTGRRAILVVERIDPKGDRAEVIYALGSDIGRRGNWRRYQAVIQEGTLSFASKATANAFEFGLKEPDELEGKLNYQASRSGTSAFRYMRMRRIE